MNDTSHPILNRLRKATGTLKLGRAFISLVRNPRDLDKVFSLSDALDKDEEIMGPIRDAFASSQHGAEGLQTQHRLQIDIETLARLPEGTLGRAFAEFVCHEGIDPDELFRDRPVTNRDEWILEHLFETHDVWHVVTGFGTDVAGELGLQAFYLSQFPARLGMLLLAGGLLNTFIFEFDDRRPRLEEITKGWAVGAATKSILGVDWNRYWTRDLDDVRAEFGIIPAPRAQVRIAA